MGTNCIPRSRSLSEKVSNHPFNQPHLLGIS
jgi:hypothetical protein